MADADDVGYANLWLPVGVLHNPLTKAYRELTG